MGSAESRRGFLRTASIATAGLVAGHAQDSAGQEHPGSHQRDTSKAEPNGNLDFPRTHPGPGGPLGSATDRGKLVPGFRSVDEPPVGVVTPDLPTLASEMKDGVREFHLTAEHVRRQILPAMHLDLWGYNGTAPGPLIEATEGERVRIVVHNELPESTTVHWHGLELPIAMDGVEGLTQDPIPPGGSFTYEFDLHQSGTFFYHSHGAMQEVMGMTGLFVVHPKRAFEPAVDYDFGLIVQEFAVLPQSTIPNSISEEFNFFTINGRSGPFVTPLVVRLGSRVRIRFMNLSAMDHHPMHLHGHTFWVTGTEGGRIPESAWIPGNNVLVGVGQSRDVEFIANNPGDWMIHCHIPHHMMNHMVSMVGPMAGMDSSTGAHGASATPALLGGELASGELGAGLEPSLGPMTSGDRAVMTGMRPSDMQAKISVPGYPQDMMEMHGILTPSELKQVSVPLTRGMRRSWPMAVHAMMTVLRVLPDELYDQVLSGKGEIAPGSSVPGTGSGAAGHNMHEGMDMNGEHEMQMPSEAEGTKAPHSEHQHREH